MKKIALGFVVFTLAVFGLCLTAGAQEKTGEDAPVVGVYAVEGLFDETGTWYVIGANENETCAVDFPHAEQPCTPGVTNLLTYADFVAAEFGRLWAVAYDRGVNSTRVVTWPGREVVTRGQ